MKAHSRYERQIILKEIGRHGQKRLDQSSVAIVGLGALGSVSANLLARAGIGRLLLIDRDYLEESNLQRQVLYDEKDVAEGLPKAVAAARHLRSINSRILIQEEIADVHPHSIEELLSGIDLVVDGTDNFETRFLINDYALVKKVPWIYGGAIRTEGMAYVVMPKEPPCLRCLFGEKAAPRDVQTCDQVGVLSTVAHLIASFQATEAIKILAGRKEAVDRQLWKVDIWNRQFKAYSVGHLSSSPCTGCSQKEYPYLEGERVSRSVVLCGRNAVQIYDAESEPVNFSDIALRLRESGAVTHNEHMLRVNLDEYEITLFRNGRAIVKGTEDTGKARSLYSRFVGS